MKMLKQIFVITIFLVVNAVSSYQAVVVANTLNVREKPTATSKVVGKLQKENVVQVELCNDGFCKIEFKSTSGYVSEKFLNQVSNTTANVEKSSSDGWGVLVLFIVLALGVTELGLRKKIGCVSAAGAVIAILCLWLLLDIFHVGMGCEILVVALAIIAIFMRNKKFLPKRLYKNELSDRNESSRKQKESLNNKKKENTTNRNESGESLVDTVIKLGDLLSFGTTSNDLGHKELLYCQWLSNELNQRFYEAFPRNTSCRDAEMALERKYGKGRLSNSARAKTPPSWYELSDGNEVLYCQWISSELVNRRFYETFPRNTIKSNAEKVLEHIYGKGRLGNTAYGKIPPSWYGF